MEDSNTYYEGYLNGFQKSVKKIAEDALRGMTWANDITNRPQIFKYKNIFNEPISKVINDDSSNSIYNNISQQPEISEIHNLTNEILLRWNSKIESQSRKRGRDSSFLSQDQLKNPEVRPNPRSQTGSQFSRIQELNFRAQLTFARLDKRLREIVKDSLKPRKSDIGFEIKDRRLFVERTFGVPFCNRHILGKELIETKNDFFIADTIYCLTEVIKNLKIFGINYAPSHTYLASSHKKLGDWCLIYKVYHRFLSTLGDSDATGFTAYIQNLIGKSNLPYLDAKYHFELAVKHYHEAKEMHGDGAAYRTMLNEMSCLEDDLGDNFYHFCAALERFQINTGEVDGKINELKFYIKSSKTFDLDMYGWANLGPLYEN